MSGISESFSEIIIEDSDSMDMKEEKCSLTEQLKTQFTGPGAQLSVEQRGKKLNRRRLATLFGRNLRNYQWSELNDEALFELIKVFNNGGFADVTLLKSKKGGKLIIVKKNRVNEKNKSDDAHDDVIIDTVLTTNINEIRQMTMVKSEYVIRCLGYSEINAGKGNFAIIMEYSAYLSISRASSLVLQCIAMHRFKISKSQLKLTSMLWGETIG